LIEFFPLNFSQVPDTGLMGQWVSLFVPLVVKYPTGIHRNCLHQSKENPTQKSEFTENIPLLTLPKKLPAGDIFNVEFRGDM